LRLGVGWAKPVCDSVVAADAMFRYTQDIASGEVRGVPNIVDYWICPDAYLIMFKGPVKNNYVIMS